MMRTIQDNHGHALSPMPISTTHDRKYKYHPSSDLPYTTTRTDITPGKTSTFTIHPSSNLSVRNTTQHNTTQHDNQTDDKHFANMDITPEPTQHNKQPIEQTTLPTNIFCATYALLPTAAHLRSSITRATRPNTKNKHQQPSDPRKILPTIHAHTHPAFLCCPSAVVEPSQLLKQVLPKTDYQGGPSSTRTPQETHEQYDALERWDDFLDNVSQWDGSSSLFNTAASAIFPGGSKTVSETDIVYFTRANVFDILARFASGLHFDGKESVVGNKKKVCTAPD
jgi:hypothetical protein